jgi:alcohol-forming fatty acyl-CoA reductase
MKLSDQERDILIENVHIIINCAEIIDYNSRLDEAIKTNIRGPLKLLELAKKMKNLEHFVHLSSAFVNADKS